MSKQIGVLPAVVTTLAAIAFVTSWSSGFLIAAIATVDIAFTTLLVWRFVPVALVLLAITVASGAFRGVARRNIGGQAVVGLFAQFGYCVFVFASIGAGITTGTTALIDAVQPLVVATLVGPLLGLRVRGAQWIGLAVGAVGVLLVVQSQIGGSDAAPLAYLFPLLAMVCLVVGTFLDRRLATELPVLLTLTVHVTVTAVALVVLAVATGTLSPPSSTSFWLQAALSAVLPTLVAYGLYWWMLRRVGITALNALLFLVAPATAVAGALMFGEPVTVLTVVGFVLCGGGVGLVLVSEARAQRRERAGARTAEPEVAGAAL
jgi:drug/metabolite transporter (DMT)-like permease